MLQFKNWGPLNVGTVPTFKMLNVGTVPTFKKLNVGTIKMSKFQKNSSGPRTPGWCGRPGARILSKASKKAPGQPV